MEKQVGAEKSYNSLQKIFISSLKFCIILNSENKQTWIQ